MGCPGVEGGVTGASTVGAGAGACSPAAAMAAATQSETDFFSARLCRKPSRTEASTGLVSTWFGACGPPLSIRRRMVAVLAAACSTASVAGGPSTTGRFKRRRPRGLARQGRLLAREGRRSRRGLLRQHGRRRRRERRSRHVWLKRWRGDVGHSHHIRRLSGVRRRDRHLGLLRQHGRRGRSDRRRRCDLRRLCWLFATGRRYPWHDW